MQHIYTYDLVDYILLMKAANLSSQYQVYIYCQYESIKLWPNLLKELLRTLKLQFGLYINQIQY